MHATFSTTYGASEFQPPNIETTPQETDFPQNSNIQFKDPLSETNVVPPGSSALLVPGAPGRQMPTYQQMHQEGVRNITSGGSIAGVTPTGTPTGTSMVSENERLFDDDNFAKMKRKRVADMTPEERLSWSRMQSRDHSRRSRQRRKQLESDLKLQIEQLQSFRTLIEDSFQLVSIQSPDHSAGFLYANSVFYRALNHVPQELIGVSIRDLAHPEDRQALDNAFALIQRDDGIPNVSIDWRISRRGAAAGEAPSYVNISSSISLNQQGVVVFSMLKNEVSSFVSPPNMSLQALSMAAASESNKQRSSAARCV